jgi:hypothetical protein
MGCGRETLLAIAHDDVNARRAHEADGRGRIGPVGHNVAGTDDPLRRNPEPRGFVEQRAGRLEIPVRPAEHDRGAVAVQLFLGLAHRRSRSTRP